MLVGAKHTQSWLKSYRRRNEQIRENQKSGFKRLNGGKRTCKTQVTT